MHNAAKQFKAHCSKRSIVQNIERNEQLNFQNLFIYLMTSIIFARRYSFDFKTYSLPFSFLQLFSLKIKNYGTFNFRRYGQIENLLQFLFTEKLTN